MDYNSLDVLKEPHLVNLYEVPTGHILVVRGEGGLLECVSLGDYGKEANIKADFLGLSQEISEVKHQEMLPLSEKWVITISTQYGCSMGCKFCSVPKVGKGLNCSYRDMLTQIQTALSLHPEIKKTQRLNLHFARMGEPSFNKEVLPVAIAGKQFTELGGGNFHPVVSTMLPKNNQFLQRFVSRWVDFKNIACAGEAGLQFSINSTSDAAREDMFYGNSLDLSEIAKLIDSPPKGRKYTLNFAVAEYEIKGKDLKKYFNPDWYVVKLTPMHKTPEALEKGIKTPGNYTTFYPYKEIEKDLRNEGFDVITFIASKEEDESGITCGNAILAHPEKLFTFCKKVK
ncbi:MAG: Fe-S-oxidoreductase [Candidatus Pacearchaeota archaeon]